MTLDKLPVLSAEVISTHATRHRSEQEYFKWINETEQYLQQKNPNVHKLIEFYAINSNDPKHVRGIAYTLLTLINHQLQADDMNNGDEIK